MSSIHFGSVSGSLPENLGAGQTTAAKTANKAQALSEQEKHTLETHLTTVKTLLTQETPPNQADLEALSTFTKDLIEDPAKAPIAIALENMVKERKAGQPDLSAEEYAVNAFSCFISTFRKDSTTIATISEKFKSQTPLTYGECRILDFVAWYSRFGEAMLKANILGNKYINLSNQLSTLANEYAFKDFKDGDVLFYDLAGRMRYNGPGPGILEKATMTALGTNYAHVGVFYRNNNKPYVAQIQGRHSLGNLSFGQMSYIRGLRVNPAKFTAAKLTEAERLEAQKNIGDKFSTIVAQNYKIGITYPQQAACVFGHTTSEPNTQLGKVKMVDNTNMLCSELAGIGLMQAFDQYNKEQTDQTKMLSNPFSEYEKMTHLHPERLLRYFGPQKNNIRVETGWEEVKPSELTHMLPKLPDICYE